MKKSPSIERVEPLEVQEISIDYLEGAGLDKQRVQHIDVEDFAVGDVDEGGDRSPQIEQRVHFMAALVEQNGAPRGTSTGTDHGAGIEGIHGIGHLCRSLVDVERRALLISCRANKEMCQSRHLLASASVERATAAPIPMW